MDPITIFICFVVLAVIIKVIQVIFNPSGSGHSGGTTASHKSSLYQPLRRSMASRMNKPGDPMYMNNLNNPNNPASFQWRRLHHPHRPKH